jgi:hypothetical protein
MDRVVRLDWPDLIIDAIDPQQFADWIDEWRFLVSGRLAPVFMNKFGAWFLRRPEGPVELLDVFAGELTPLASSFEEFQAKVNDPSWHEVYLGSKVVYDLHQAGLVPNAGECYAMVSHPLLGGPDPMLGKPADPARVMVMPIRAWQSICAQAVQTCGQ